MSYPPTESPYYPNCGNPGCPGYPQGSVPILIPTPDPSCGFPDHSDYPEGAPPLPPTDQQGQPLVWIPGNPAPPPTIVQIAEPLPYQYSQTGPPPFVPHNSPQATREFEQATFGGPITLRQESPTVSANVGNPFGPSITVSSPPAEISTSITGGHIVQRGEPTWMLARNIRTDENSGAK